MSKRQYVRVFTLMIALVFILSACAGGKLGNNQASDSGQGETSASGAGEKITLNLWYWEGDMEKPWRENLIKDFEEENPNIKINFQILPWAQYWQKLQTASAAGEFPDVFIMSVAYVDEYAKRGLLLDLHPYMDRGDLRKEDYFDNAFQSVRWPDKKTGDEYAFPWNLVNNALYYNKTLFDEAGVKYPDDNWTWDDVMSAAQKITKITNSPATTRYGFVSSSDYTMYDSVVHSFGGTVVKDDLSESLLNQPEAVKATQYLVDMITKYKVAPAPGQLEGQATPFESGKVGMQITGSWLTEPLSKVTEFKWDIAPVPKGPAGRFIRGWSDSIAIYKNTKHPEEAWKFIKFLVSEKGQTLENLGYSRIPVYKPMAMSDKWLQAGNTTYNKKAILDFVDQSSPLSFRGGWGEWNPAMVSELDQAFLGKKTVQQASDAAKKAIDAILARNR
jgi:multiple sugar transport system substrate-binding protein